MLHFSLQLNIFDGLTLYYEDEITNKPCTVQVTVKDVERVKNELRRANLIGLCAWFLINLQAAMDFMIKANPHHITKQFKEGLSQMTIACNRCAEKTNLEELAFHIHLHIYPTLITIQPRSDNRTTKRYLHLIDVLDENLTAILADNVCNVKTVKNGPKAENY